MPNDGMNASGPDIDEYETPDWLYRSLDTEFSFTLDPCATELTRKCSRFYTKKENGLTAAWSGERVFVNPPYSEFEKVCSSTCTKMRCSKRGWHRNEENPGLDAWVVKAATEIGLIDGANLIVMLLPARTGSVWFAFLHRAAEIRFFRRRIPFFLYGVELTSPRFDSLLAILRAPRL